MENNNPIRSVSLKSDTIEKLKTLKSCYQLAYKIDISYDEIINLLLDKSLPYLDKKINDIYNLVNNTTPITNDENNETLNE